MKKSVSLVLVVSMFGMTTLTGCETMGGSAATGAGLGGLAGGIIGHQSGRGIEGALIGALIGAAAGAIVHDVRDRQTRTAQQTYDAYDYRDDQGFRLNIEGTKMDPPQVPAGQNAEGSFNYAVLGAGQQVPVKERFVLMTESDEVLAEVYSEDVTRTDGTYHKAVTIEFPEDVPAGTYRLTSTVSSQGTTNRNYTDFNVLPTTAKAEPGAARGEFKIAVVSR